MPTTIPDAYRGRYIYHFTHVDNLKGLLKSGLLANNHPSFPKNEHRSVAARGIQQRRATMVVPCGPGGCVHDYVPLYFGSLSLMLLSVINAKNVDQMDILYFEFPIELIQRDDVVFTDASANTQVPPGFYSDPSDLDKLNWNVIDSKKWREATDVLRHQRMAEVLVHKRLKLTEAKRCVVWNESIKKDVAKIVAGSNFPEIGFQDPPRYHWFTPFFEKSKASLVTGPREISLIYEEACKEVSRALGTNKAAAKFDSLTTLLDGLRKNFGCTSHTAELVGLKSANGIHKRTVDIHTKEVVDKLRSLEAFKKLPSRSQRLTELAAYLHDIGKGPRSRWDSNGGLQKVDPNHPVGAMPMIADILVNQVGTASEASAHTLMKLICYHDLVGDVLGKGRDERQIVDVVSSVEELDMLFALGEADATVLVEAWWNEAAAAELYKRCKAAIQKSK